MRILFADQYSAFGGAQLVLRDVIAGAIREGWEAELAAPGNGPLLDICPSAAFPLFRYTNGRKTALEFVKYSVDMARTAAAIREITRRRPPDLIYVNGPRILPAATAQGLPVVFHSHSLLARGYARWIANRCVRAANALVIASSGFVRAPLSHGDCEIIYNGVSDLGFFRKNPRGNSVHIGILGRISPEKGHLDFIDAARVLASLYTEARFSVFGAGLFSDPGFERTVRAAAAGSPVEFRGWTNDVAGALHEVDLLAVPSGELEATPRVIMEAFSAGTPVVAYPSGGIRELVRDGETGFLTADATAFSLVVAIRKALASPERMAQVSANARREWKARFRVERMQSEICDLIRKRFANKSRQADAAAAVACIENAV
ncbi:MAG TPA: glycosyltransferase family 4 protein [Bryobacteraceae bacterium]|nr:glycosyltransferase family 4 protein [Bryobacteraceae bacterium]